MIELTHHERTAVEGVPPAGRDALAVSVDSDPEIVHREHLSDLGRVGICTPERVEHPPQQLDSVLFCRCAPLGTRMDEERKEQSPPDEHLLADLLAPRPVPERDERWNHLGRVVPHHAQLVELDDRQDEVDRPERVQVGRRLGRERDKKPKKLVQDRRCRIGGREGFGEENAFAVFIAVRGSEVRTQ